MSSYRNPALACCLALGLAASAGAQPLAEVVRGVVQTSPEARSAAANLRATAQELEQARAGYFPSVEVRVETGRETIESPALRAAGVGSRSLDREQGSLVARQMIYDGGLVASEVARQGSRMDAARWRLAEVRESLSVRTAEVYLDLLQAEGLLALARENVAIHRETLAKTARRFELGVGGRADVEQAEARLAVAQATVVSREAAQRDAHTRYERIVGTPPGTPLVPDEPPVPAERQQLLDRAAARHPSLHTAMADLAAARAATEGARAPFLPKVDLELNSARGRNVDGTTGRSNETTALVVMRYNLFRGGADVARERELGERRNGAEESLANTRRVVQEDAARAWIALSASREALTFLERHVEASAAALKAYRSQFELGRRTLLDLLNAESELFQAKSTWTTARLDVRRNQFRMLTSMGALAEHFGVEPEPAPAAP